MSNMSYCRFRNTLTDLMDCEDHINDEEINEDELIARNHLIQICKSISEHHEEIPDPDEEENTENKFFYHTGEYKPGSIPEEAIEDCSYPGRDADPYVKQYIKQLQFSVPMDIARKWLKPFGAWEIDQLSDEEVTEKVFWLACCDLKENKEWFGLIH